MRTYRALAACYDGFTTDVQYERRARYLSRLLALPKEKSLCLLDLACGTGSLTEIFLRRGYRMVGVDLSEDMLCVAANKFTKLPPEQRPLFLQQDMTALTLPFSVDGVFCALDSLNYLLRPADVKKTFARVAKVLRPGGCFVFDVHTISHLQSLDGGMFMDENENNYCVWRAEYASRSHILTYTMDIFQKRQQNLWQRDFEIHKERGYSPEELTSWLEAEGFTDIRLWGDLTYAPPKADEKRLYFSARRK